MIKKRDLMALATFSVLILGTSCSTAITQKKELDSYKKELHKDDLKMSEMEEANIDDDLNAVERKDVHQIFEKDIKEKKRAEDAIF